MRTLIVVIALALCVLVYVPRASSQILTGTIKTTVDTNFIVGNIQLPAGEYTFSFDTAIGRMYIHALDTVSVFTVTLGSRVFQLETSWSSVRTGSGAFCIRSGPNRRDTSMASSMERRL